MDRRRKNDENHQIAKKPERMQQGIIIKGSEQNIHSAQDGKGSNLRPGLIGKVHSCLRNAFGDR